MGVGTEDIEATDSLFVSQPQIVANFQDLGYSGSGGYKATAAITATAAGTTPLTVTSLRKQIFTGTTTQTITMPDVTTLAVGFAFEITNNSTGVLTIQSSGTNEICKIQPTERAILTCIAITGTTAASWTYSIIKSIATTTSLSQQVSIQSDPTGAVEGGITDFLASGLTLVNSVVNGDFASGTTGWTNNGLATFTLANQTMTLLANSTSDSMRYTSFSIIDTNKYFFAVYLKSTSSGVGMANYNGSATYTTYHSGSGNYEWVTRTFTSAATVSSPFVIQFIDTRSSGWDEFYVDGNAGIFAINMTALGLDASGLNYTEAQMLNLVRGGYFEGMANTKNLAVKSITKNRFDKSKVTYNFQVDNTDGTDTASTGETASEYIKIDENETLYISGCSGTSNTDGAYYDSQKNYISGFTSYASALTIPTSTVYIRFTVDIDDLDTAQIGTDSVYESYRQSLFETESELRSVKNATGLTRDTVDADGNRIKRISDFVAIADSTEVNTTNYTDAKNGGYYLVLQDNGIMLNGTVGDAVTTSDAGDVIYELATPVITDLVAEGKASGIVKSFANGTIYQDCAYNQTIAASATPDITLTEALREITQLTYVNTTTDETIEVPVSGLTLSSDGLTITGSTIPASTVCQVKGYLKYNISALLTGNVTVNQSAVIASLNAIVDKQSAQITSLTDITNLLIALV